MMNRDALDSVMFNWYVCCGGYCLSPPVTNLSLFRSGAPNGNWSGLFSLSTARDFAAASYCNQSRRYLRASRLAVCQCKRGITQETGFLEATSMILSSMASMSGWQSIPVWPAGCKPFDSTINLSNGGTDAGNKGGGAGGGGAALVGVPR
jgi:hypothetical protein